MTTESEFSMHNFQQAEACATNNSICPVGCVPRLRAKALRRAQARTNRLTGFYFVFLAGVAFRGVAKSMT